MTIGDISAAAAPTAFNVKLSKSQEDQQAKVVNKLIESTEASSPANAPGVGRLVNVTA